jgi:hypothetical protein
MLARRLEPALTSSLRNTFAQRRHISHHQKQVRLPHNFLFQLNSQLRPPVKVKVMATTTAEANAISRLHCIVQTQSIVGYRFKNVLYLWEALQAPNPERIMVDGRYLFRGNESMAIVGDSALQTALVGMWFKSGQQKGTETALYDFENVLTLR